MNRHLCTCVGLFLGILLTDSLSAICQETVSTPGNNAAQEGKDTLNSDDLATQVAKQIPEILDSHLEQAAISMLKLAKEYRPPSQGECPENSECEEALCRSSRKAFALYERYELLYGCPAASAVRQTITDLHALATDKLSWAQEQPEDSMFFKAWYSTSERLRKLKKPGPLERAGIELARRYQEEENKGPGAVPKEEPSSSQQ